MPKVYLSQTERLNERLSTWLYGQLRARGIRQTQLAEQMGISQQRLSYKLNAKSFTYKDFLKLIDLLNPDLTDIEWLLNIRGNKK